MNCPFDEEYRHLLRPLLFTVRYLGFFPRVALEVTDSGEPRIVKILSLVSESRYGIHDVSRLRAEKEGDYFRLNMPFELGLDYGCRYFKKGKWQDKRCVILEKEKYRYQAALSDLSSSDILAHGDRPEEVVLQVRNWLVEQLPAGVGPSGTKVWYAYNDFWTALYGFLEQEGFSKEEIDGFPTSEFLRRLTEWIGEGTFSV